MKYRLSVLGGYNFERLAQTILKVIIGPGVSSFGGTHDLGRDATFRGTADYPSAAERWSGFWVFQAKHADHELRGAVESRSAIIAEIKEELLKVTSRHQDRTIDNYVLLTSVPFDARSRNRLMMAVRESGLEVHFALIDGNEVCEFLDIHPHIRRAFPQLLALADLSHIVNKEVQERSEAYLRTAQPTLETFVRTTVYDKAFELLRRLHFIVLDGPPEAGKTTIARALALWYATTGFGVIDLQHTDDFFRVFDVAADQLFVADDAVGSDLPPEN